MYKKLFPIFQTIFLFLIISCGSDQGDISSVPQPTTKASKIFYQNDFAFHFGHQKGFNYSQLKVKKDINFLLLDGSYMEVDYYDMKKFNSWFYDLKFNNGVMAIDQKENLDCDNFALLYKSLFSVSHYKSDAEQEPAVALVIVEQKFSFGGIPKGGLHMLNLIFTNNGWYIFEPQTGKSIVLEDYVNQEFIQFIII
jgi:hypothetical protein